MPTTLTPMVIALGFALAAPGRARDAAPPRLAVTPGGRQDLGMVGPLETRILEYTFGNRSRRPISLRVLDLSPGVTVAGPALRAPIPARGAAALTLRVDPAGWVGPQTRNVRLGTDDPGQGAYYLPIRMTVRPDLTVDGPRRNFGDVAVYESPMETYTFMRETGKPLTVRVVTPLPGYLECEVQSSGPRATAAFTLRPGRIPPGMELGLECVRVETNAPLQPRFDLYLEWRVHHPIEAIPSRVVFRDPGPDTLDLRLRARNGVPFRILEAALDGAGFQLGRPSPAAAAEQVLAIRRSAPGGARAILVLRCSGEAEPLRVPVASLP